jgi:hypothetical protein
VAAARRFSARFRTYFKLIPFLLALFTNAPVASKEAVIFEQIGQLAGVTAYLHVHIELSITSVEQQLDKYIQLLVTKLGTKDSIRHFMLSQYEPEPKATVFFSDSRVNLNRTQNQNTDTSNLVRANTMLWKKITALHLQDVEDIEHHISSLRNALPPIPGRNPDRVHVSSPFVPARPNAEQFFVHPYPDTHDHLLFTGKSDPEGFNVHLADEENPTKANRSRGLNPHDPHGEIDEPPIPAKVRVASTTDKPKLHGRKKRSAVPDPVLASKPLTEEAFDNMVPVQDKRAFLGAVALPLAVAATAMGLFNRAQIENLRGELFQQKKATRRLFEVVQDFSQNFVGLQNSFNELWSLLFSNVLANPTLLDA